MTSGRIWCCALAGAFAVIACHETPEPDVAEKARVTKAWKRMEAAQLRSDIAVSAIAARANAKADAVRNKAIIVEKNDAINRKKTIASNN